MRFQLLCLKSVALLTGYPTHHLSSNDSRTFYRRKHIQLAVWWWRTGIWELFFFVQNNASPWRLKMPSIIVKGQSLNMEDELNADSSVFCSVNQGTVKERSFVEEAKQPISNPKSVAINISDITVWVQIWLLSWYFGGELTHTGGFICPSCQVEDLQEDLLCWTAHMSKCILIKNKHWTGAGQVKLP